MKTYLSFLLPLLSLALNAQPEFSSHRGSSLEAPENTIAAVLLAWEQGADAVEIDIHLSKDKRLMVIHDTNTKKTSGMDYVVKDTHSSILRTLDVGSYKGEAFKGEKIPFLEEIIAVVPTGKKLIVELKCDTKCLPQVKKIIKKHKRKTIIDMISFDFQTITLAKKMLPDISCHWLINGRNGLEDKIRKAADAGLDAVDIRHTDIDKDIVSLAHKYNLKVVAWTVDDPVEALRLVDLGVDGIESNCVSCLKEKISILDHEDSNFPESLTRDVLESSRIYPGQTISSDFWPNNTGGILIRPGGRDCYPAYLTSVTCPYSVFKTLIIR